MEIPVLVLPGFGNSGPGHWQTLWEERHPAWRRVDLGQWDAPRVPDWVRALDAGGAALASLRPSWWPIVSPVCWWLTGRGSQRCSIKGAFLVAVPEPASPQFPSHRPRFQSGADAPVVVSQHGDSQSQ